MYSNGGRWRGCKDLDFRTSETSTNSPGIEKLQSTPSTQTWTTDILSENIKILLGVIRDPQELLEDEEPRRRPRQIGFQWREETLWLRVWFETGAETETGNF